MFYRSKEVAVSLQVVVDLVDGNFRIRLGCERVAALGLFQPQRIVVFNYAVVYQGNFIPADMGMGIIDARTSVGRPAGMGKTGFAVQG